MMSGRSMVVGIAGGVVAILSLACDWGLVGCCEQFRPRNTRGEDGEDQL